MSSAGGTPPALAPVHESAVTDVPEPLFTLDVTCEGAPLQLQGTVGGVPYYFRSRHGRWRIEAGAMIVAEGNGDPSIPLAAALIVDALWPHFMRPELDAREEARWVDRG